ncbi:tRNA (N6-isopentenyl adenosine(37)-C2)-methylthiotransferase MiaB [Malacoplasma muris]|uniref:tRNA (N6-isopentenyl adenosine(37)-C2)-methylthiotransferase MiaB n=1 Tax=Malacoplasma muris TaxID=2119 RepID=UPI00398E7911
MNNNFTRKRDLSKYFLPNINRARKRLEDAKTLKDNFEIPTNLIGYGINKKFHIKTFGCQSNVRDTETMMGILEMIGYKHTDDIKEADLVLLNTCAIRDHAEQKVFADIGVLDKIKKTNPNFIFGMCGCMAQEEAVVNRILKSNFNIDFIFGTHNIHRLLNILEQVLFEKNLVVEVWSKEGDIIENLPTTRNNNIKAFVNVMYGCDKFCTYCIVPFTRGKIRSRSKQDILDEINELIRKGYKEVTLIGQNVNSYGIDLKGENYVFSNLLEDVAKTNIERVRFTTSNPWNFTKEIVDIMKKYKNIMPHIHLPIQSGDELILKKMNRPMKIQDYLDLINYIKENIPYCSITTDLIVGFPNETREQFERTLDLYNKIQFDNAFTFIYSKRDGTIAANLPDSTSMSDKKEWLLELNELVKKYAKSQNQKFVGLTLDVLVEGPSKKDQSIMSGYSPQWKVVNFKGEANPGDIVKVKIITASRFTLNGEIVK